MNTPIPLRSPMDSSNPSFIPTDTSSSSFSPKFSSMPSLFPSVFDSKEAESIKELWIILDYTQLMVAQLSMSLGSAL